MEEILKDIEMKGRIKGIRKLRDNVERVTETILVRIENEEQKRKEEIERWKGENHGGFNVERKENEV